MLREERTEGTGREETFLISFAGPRELAQALLCLLLGRRTV